MANRLPPLIAAKLPPLIKAKPKKADRFYSSAAWVQLRDRVRREAGGMCQVPGCTQRGVIVDHIHEIKDGGAKLERSNCVLLCAAHHGTKTHRAWRQRAGLR